MRGGWGQGGGKAMWKPFPVIRRHLRAALDCTYREKRSNCTRYRSFRLQSILLKTLFWSQVIYDLRNTIASNIMVNVEEPFKRFLKNNRSKNFGSFPVKQPLKSKIRNLCVFEYVPLFNRDAAMDSFLGFFLNIPKIVFRKLQLLHHLTASVKVTTNYQWTIIPEGRVLLKYCLRFRSNAFLFCKRLPCFQEKHKWRICIKLC